jgi:hypothetical protein
MYVISFCFSFSTCANTYAPMCMYVCVVIILAEPVQSSLAVYVLGPSHER